MERITRFVFVALLLAVPLRAGLIAQWTQVSLGKAVPFQLAGDKDGSIWGTDYVNRSIDHLTFDPTPQVQINPIDLGPAVTVNFVDGTKVEDEGPYATFTGEYLGGPFTGLVGMTRDGRFDFVVIDDSAALKPRNLARDVNYKWWITNSLENGSLIRVAGFGLLDEHRSNPEISSHQPPSLSSSPVGVVMGRDGNLYFTSDNGIGLIHPDNSFSFIPANALYLSPGSDGNMWFTDPAEHALGRLKNGAITSFPLPDQNALPTSIAPGADGLLYSNERNTGAIYRWNPKSATDSGFVEIEIIPGPAPLPGNSKGFEIVVQYLPTGAGGPVTRIVENVIDPAAKTAAVYTTNIAANLVVC